MKFEELNQANLIENMEIVEIGVSEIRFQKYPRDGYK